MATLTRDCPHCKDKSSSFTIRWSDICIRGGQGSHVAAATCGGCGLPICFQVRTTNNNPVMGINGSLDTFGSAVVGVIWPIKEGPSIPRHLPPDYAAKIQEAENAFHAKLPTAAAGLFRALVDTTTKRQLTDSELETKGVLMVRIDRLADNHVIPKAVAEWAHEVRAIGNEGLHEEMVVSPEDAEATRNFAQTYLRYAFELPGDIAARRTKP